MNPTSASYRVQRCQEILAHAWMVRTFVKHSDEAEDFPELMQLPRMVFDLCRAVEHLVDRPEEYLRILRKKLGKLKKAIEQFAHDAPLASAHTNFQQAVISIQACHRELQNLATVPGQKSYVGSGSERQLRETEGNVNSTETGSEERTHDG